MVELSRQTETIIAVVVSLMVLVAVGARALSYMSNSSEEAFPNSTTRTTLKSDTSTITSTFEEEGVTTSYDYSKISSGTSTHTAIYGTPVNSGILVLFQVLLPIVVLVAAAFVILKKLQII